MTSKQTFFSIIILLAVVLIGVGVFSGKDKLATNDQYNNDSESLELTMDDNQNQAMTPEELAQYVTHTATLQTSDGDIVIDLYGQLAPKTVDNFVKLANEGFYDGVRFHRVIAGFMIQSGDPLSKDEDMRNRWGTGGPGYTFEDEFAPQLRHSGPGILSMANAGPGTNGSQFFITLDATPHLNDRHTVFGSVVGGMDVVNMIGTSPTAPNDQPIDDIMINGVEITEK